MLHPYGRYCNAFKFAGETDVFEALEHCKKHYRIDEKRLVVRGFSMGGAGCWHLAVHHPDKWCAAAPGAGFAETPEYAKINKDEVPWWEQKLWHWYNATDYAENLKSLPTVAYSGEIDKQKQAADVMAREMKKFGLTLRHIIGPKMGHKYHPEAKREINRVIDAQAEYGATSYSVDFSTYFLRYQPSSWIRIEGMEEQWRKAYVAANWCFHEQTPGYTGCGIVTNNITALSISVSPFMGKHLTNKTAKVNIDQQVSSPIKAQSDGSLVCYFRKEAGVWKLVDTLDDSTLHKKPASKAPLMMPSWTASSS